MMPASRAFAMAPELRVRIDHVGAALDFHPAVIRPVVAAFVVTAWYALRPDTKRPD